MGFLFMVKEVLNKFHPSESKSLPLLMKDYVSLVVVVQSWAKTLGCTVKGYQQLSCSAGEQQVTQAFDVSADNTLVRP